MRNVEARRAVAEVAPAGPGIFGIVGDHFVAWRSRLRPRASCLVDRDQRRRQPQLVCALASSDQGPGIEPELLSHVFEPLVRGGEPGDIDRDGAGLGLTIAARFLESQGGTISAANTAAGGACLTLRLPRATPT
jgi:signal transduction histidine kinase